MRALRDTWLRERRRRPAAARLAVVAAVALVAGGALAAFGVMLLAQLVVGLALVPLTLATYLRLLPAAPFDDGRGWGGPGRGGGDRGGPPPPAGPDAGVDWDRFEAQFRAYAEQRERVPA